MTEVANIGRFLRLVCRAKKPLGEGAPAYGGRQSISMQLTAHADDKLIVEGHPVVAGDGTHVLLVQSCVSMLQ